MKRKYHFPFLLLLVFTFPILNNNLSLSKATDKSTLNHGNKSQSVDSADVSFGFADSSGQYFLASEINPHSRNSYYVEISSGKIFKLEFVEERGEEKQSTGRQISSNFNNVGGYLFQSPYIKLDPDKTYLIADSNYLSQHTRLSIEPVSYTPLTTNNIEKIEEVKGKQIKSNWQLGKTDDGIILALVLFQPGKDTALASLVLIKNNLFVFEDYPGNLKDEYSVWRVDDNGEFNPQSINVIALFHSPDGYEIARTWAGEEGESSVFLVQRENVFNPVKEYYRYWVAE
ncbi:MAG: hypothetical protein P8Z35_12880 [Ignavibacteriaceae bacterium]